MCYCVHVVRIFRVNICFVCLLTIRWSSIYPLPLHSGCQPKDCQYKKMRERERWSLLFYSSVILAIILRIDGPLIERDISLPHCLKKLSRLLHPCLLLLLIRRPFGSWPRFRKRGAAVALFHWYRIMFAVPFPRPPPATLMVPRMLKIRHFRVY